MPGSFVGHCLDSNVFQIPAVYTYLWYIEEFRATVRKIFKENIPTPQLSREMTYF